MASEGARTTVPDEIVLERHRDLQERERWVTPRRVVLALLLCLALLGLLNLFGQRPVSQTVRTGPASLKVYAPVHLRSGDIFTARFHIYAYSDLKQATLVLSPGWFEGMTFNGISPQPVSEGSADGQPTFVFGHVPAGHSVIAFFSMQVNPTNVGHRSSNVSLYDGTNRVLSVHRSFTIWP